MNAHNPSPIMTPLCFFYENPNSPTSIIPQRFLLHIQKSPYVFVGGIHHCLFSLFLVSDSSLVCYRRKVVHRFFLYPFSLVTFHKKIFSTFMTKLYVLQCVSKATIYGRRLVLHTEDCDLRLHRNPAMEI